MSAAMDHVKPKSNRSLPFIGGTLLAAVSLVLAGCSKPVNPWEGAHGKHIMTSFVPLYCIAANVAGDDGTVHCLLTSKGPHDYHAAFDDALQLRGADIFFINGLDLDSDLAKRLADNSGNKNLKLVDLGKCEALKPKLLSIADDDDDKGKEAGHHHHGGTDPHVWLGIPEAIILTQCIRDELIKIDPEHRAGYEKRAADYVAKLQKIGEDGKKALADKKDRKLVAFHDSLQYFSRNFDLKVVASIEGMAGQEPDPGHFKEILNKCQRDGVRVIAVEPQYPRTTAATALLNELKNKGVTDVVLAEVDPIETAEPSELAPDYYEKKMRENIDNLAKALK
jgi:zinc transport system substrate-binding protein